MKAILKSVFEGATLNREQAGAAMRRMTSGEVPPEQIAAFLGALRARKETLDELVGFAATLRELAVPFPAKRADLIDTCGTGGDESGTFNISTACSFVLAGGGLGVAKHGNRSISSLSGSADVMEKLGVKIDCEPAKAAACIDEFGLGFLFAPHFHPALKTVGPVRKAIGVRTAFNVLGPLANPARTRFQVLGVFDSSLIVGLAEVLRELGATEVMVVSSRCGLDEISLSDSTRVAHLKQGQIKEYEISPDDAGLARAPRDALKGGDAVANAALIERILKGEERGPKRDVVVLNSAAGFLVTGRARTLKEGAVLAKRSLDSGTAFEVLQKAREKHR